MAGAIHRHPGSGKSPRIRHELLETNVPRPILILLIVLVVIIGALFVLAGLDGEQPVARVEQPVTNAATR
jgi:hypothetical protein